MNASAIPSDHPAHKHLVAHLRDRMAEISESYWCAGWLIDLEFVLWHAIHGGRDFRAFAGLSDDELRELKELSELVGGWHDHDRFIPIDEWRTIVASKTA
jgi:hypothetical protein